MFHSLGNFINRHYRSMLAVSVIALITAGFFGVGVFGNLSHADSDFSDKSSQSYQALQAIQSKFNGTRSDLTLLFETKGDKTIDDPTVKSEIQRLLAELPPNLSAVSYFSTGAEQFVTQDRQQTFATITIKSGDSDEIIENLRADLESDAVTAYVGGQKAISHDVNAQVEKDLAKAETLSFAILAILLVIVFRSLVAASLPLLLGAVAILGAFFVTNMLTNFTNISNYAINVIIMVGLGLSIDYSLFIVGRFREELRAGKTVPDALSVTVATAGRTVFFSGLTVILSLLSLLVFPLDFLRSMGLGGSAAVLVAMVSALLILPAILRLLGHKVNALSFGQIKRERAAAADGQTTAEKPSIWVRSGRFFMSWPWASVEVILALLLIMGAQFYHAHFALPDYRSLPEGSEARLVSERLTNDFDVAALPLRLVYTTEGEITSAGNAAKLDEYIRQLNSLIGVESVQIAGAKDSIALINVSYEGQPEDSTAQDLVTEVRGLTPPSGAAVLVGGAPAELHDLLESLQHYIPIGLAVIVITLFILLFLMLGSVVTPIVAILMNILSLSTAYGAMVWVFQDGHFTGPLNLTHTGTLDATMPVLIFAIAFGLSMDYSVFLYSRIKESFDKSGDNEASVLEGLQKTGSIITSASILLFVVVGAFATARVPIMQQIGLGLALTVLVDAFLVRMILVPSLMKLIGRYNWWAPAPLKRFQQRLGLSD